MSLLWPLGLLGLLAVPLLAAGLFYWERRRMRYAVRYTNLGVLAGVADTSPAWRRRLPPVLALLAIGLLAWALARPHVAVSAPREQATIVLVIDTSGSMMAQDVKPTRLDAARRAVHAFMDKVPDSFRIGIVSFSSDAQVVAPPTTDRQVLSTALDYLSFGSRTAMGDGLARGISLVQETNRADASGGNPAPARDGDKPLAAVLLLSDGFNNWGLVQPLQAARRAKAAGIPVYTVALGTPNGVLVRDWGGFRRTIPVPPDPETLRQMAQIAGGQSFPVQSSDRLKKVYEGFGSRLGYITKQREVTGIVLAGGAALLAAALGLSFLWAPRLP
jgi:Ca-activated chloride channel family protein